VDAGGQWDDDDEAGEDGGGDDSDDDPMGGDSADCPGVQLRSTWKSHYISPPPAPMREDDRVLIIPVGDR